MLTLEHIGICAKDTIALKDWYIKLFNFKIVYDNKKEKPTYFLLMEDNSMLEIYAADNETEALSNKYQGIRHLSFGTDDIEKEYENLLEHNVEIIEAIKENAKGIKTVFFKDIEGNIIHFIQRPESLY
ncbi:Glyoxalase/Bleomycin resistance protein/Dioxygenase superfamily protein [Natronincola peptidivorans]|uniref:Glyoxalase/Bleomycin resistance protein/Dioxygenase superfamily protein n=1 Tax=Natronincola peptidivorans TaxID=426128 RepID=A0A1I0G950_9FIRM|nr:VOC family protein [Natronincola peptidivorans]SET66447.1 Glyoxalase/Bleomycin resistance protein/Dioxygenase superfamily protein [Natronincola peptidivorans]